MSVLSPSGETNAQTSLDKQLKCRWKTNRIAGASGVHDYDNYGNYDDDMNKNIEDHKREYQERDVKFYQNLS